MLDAQIKQTDPVTVAFMKMRGPYEQMPEGYRRLYEWVDHYGLQPAGMPQAIFITQPAVTPEQDAEWELWAPIAGGAGKTEADETGVGVKRVEPESVASTMHTGRYDDVGSVYEQLEKWLAEHGYKVIGPAREVYYSGPDTPEEQAVTEIQLPVMRQ